MRAFWKHAVDPPVPHSVFKRTHTDEIASQNQEESRAGLKFRTWRRLMQSRFQAFVTRDVVGFRRFAHENMSP